MDVLISSSTQCVDDIIHMSRGWELIAWTDAFVKLQGQRTWPVLPSCKRNLQPLTSMEELFFTYCMKV